MAKPNLRWLLPPKVPKDGVMPLADHLKELRYRLMVSVVVLVVGMIVCAFFYQKILAFLLVPYDQTLVLLNKEHPNLSVQGVLHDSLSPIALVLRTIGMASIVCTSPLWLYEVWAYIRPALLKNEKLYALLFIGSAAPLFLAGCALAYYAMPRGIALMMSFTPDSVQITNMLAIDSFINLLLQVMLIFGAGFLMPLLVVALNLIGILSGETLKKWRKGVIFGCFLFAGLFTPGGDPFSMMALAIPMMVLFFIAEAVCHGNDKRRAKRKAEEEAAEAAEEAAEAAERAARAKAAEEARVAALAATQTRAVESTPNASLPEPADEAEPSSPSDPVDSSEHDA